MRSSSAGFAAIISRVCGHHQQGLRSSSAGFAVIISRARRCSLVLMMASPSSLRPRPTSAIFAPPGPRRMFRLQRGEKVSRLATFEGGHVVSSKGELEHWWKLSDVGLV